MIENDTAVNHTCPPCFLLQPLTRLTIFRLDPFITNHGSSHRRGSQDVARHMKIILECYRRLSPTLPGSDIAARLRSWDCKGLGTALRTERGRDASNEDCSPHRSEGLLLWMSAMKIRFFWNPRKITFPCNDVNVSSRIQSRSDVAIMDAGCVLLSFTCPAKYGQTTWSIFRPINCWYLIMVWLFGTSSSFRTVRERTIFVEAEGNNFNWCQIIISRACSRAYSSLILFRSQVRLTPFHFSLASESYIRSLRRFSGRHTSLLAWYQSSSLGPVRP